MKTGGLKILQKGPNFKNFPGHKHRLTTGGGGGSNRRDH